MKFAHNIHELGPKRTPVLNFWFFDFPPFYGGFSIPPLAKIVVFDPPSGQKSKIQKFSTGVLFGPNSCILCANFIKIRSKLNEKIDFSFFSQFSTISNFRFNLIWASPYICDWGEKYGDFFVTHLFHPLTALQFNANKHHLVTILNKLFSFHWYAFHWWKYKLNGIN